MRLSDTQRRQMLLGYGASVASALSYGAGTFVSRIIVTDYASPMAGAALSLMFGLAIMSAVFYRDAISDLPMAPPAGVGFHSPVGPGIGLGGELHVPGSEPGVGRARFATGQHISPCLNLAHASLPEAAGACDDAHGSGWRPCGSGCRAGRIRSRLKV